MPSRIGEKFGSYELIQFLGRGGFAEVYLGKHMKLPQQMAAIKILDKQLISAKSHQFQKEASILVNFRHPNIVQMYDYNVYSTELTATLVPYIIMEYAPNKSLRVKHPRGQALPTRTIITYTKQIADALQYAHDQGVMHLDVKPENILINAQHKLLLSDFGLATLLTEEEKTGDIQGTLSYMSPEHLEGKPGFASDQYALGVMVYEWVCGHLPFSGQSVNEIIAKHLQASPPSLRAQLPNLSPQAEAVIFRALEKRPADRFPSIEGFADALDQALSTPKASAPKNTAVPGTPRPLESLVNNPVSPIAANNAFSPDGGGMVQSPPITPVEPVSAPNLNAATPSPVPQPVNQAPFASIVQPATPAPVNANASPPLVQAGGAQGNSPPFFAASPTGQGNSFLPPAPGQGNSFIPQPGQGNSFLPPAPGQGNSFFISSAGGSPFHPGPPPVAPQPAPSMGTSPFLNTIPSSPSATTVFNLPPAGPFPGAGAPAGPGPLPAYLTGSNPGGQFSLSSAQDKNFAHFFKRSFLKLPPTMARKRRQPLLLAGIAANVFSLIFVGIWLVRLLPSYHDLTAAWLLIFALAGSLGTTVLFFHSGNKTLSCVLSVLLAIYWGIVGNAFGDVTQGSFLFDPSILSFACFLGSLVLHLFFTFTWR